jgi:hypothetical protein
MMRTKSLKNSFEKKVLLPTYHFVTSFNFLLSLVIVIVFLGLLFMYPAFSATSPSGTYVKHLYTEFDGNLYTYGFKICTNNFDLHYVIVSVSSDSQTFTVTSDDTINAGKCSKIFGIKIHAEDPSSIRTTLIDNTFV